LFKVLDRRGNQQEDAKMFANFATAITSSTAVTLALLYVMNMLIGIQPGAVVDVTDPFEVNWVRVPPPITPPIPTPPKRIDDPVEPPPTPTMTNEYSGQSEIAVPRALPRTPRHGYNPIAGLTPDGPLVAIVRVRPMYPAVAKQRDLSGFAVVEFDVLTDGTVANVAIVESSNRLFESSSIRAAQKMRFKPRVVDGVPQVSTGVQYRFTFEMETAN
jgi:protein TonB